MNTELSNEQIDDYQRDGVVVHRGLLSSDEVEELKNAILDTTAKMGSRKIAEGGKDLRDNNDYYSKVFTQRLNLSRVNNTIKKYVCAQEIGAMIEKLEGVKKFRMWHDQALIKEAYANPTAFHLDNPYWSFYSRHAISIWISLGPATYQNGCMWFVPGSHKIANFENSGIGSDIAALFEAYPEMKGIDPVGIPMEAGDCSFHNGLTAHGAGANMTRSRRIAMTCGYMPDGSTFNGQQNILSDEYFNSLKEGDVLKNDDWNPLI